MPLFQDKKVLTAYLAVCLIWGSTYLAIRIGVRDVPPMLFAGSRHIIAGLLMLAIVKVKHYEMPKTKEDYTRIAIAGLLLLTAANGVVVIAEQWVESGFISLIVAINPILILLFEWLVLKTQKFSPMYFFSFFIGFSGVAMLVGGGTNLSQVPTFALVISFLAPIAWAAGSLIISKKPLSGHIFAISGVQILAGGIGQFLVGLLLGEQYQTMHITVNAVMAWLYLIFFGSLIGYVAYQYTLKKMPTSVAATSTYVNPVVAVSLGVIILGETLTAKTVLATAMIICSVILLNWSKQKNKAAPSIDK